VTNHLALLLSLPLQRMRNTLRRPDRIRWPRWLFIGGVGLMIMGAVYGLLRLVFAYFYRQPVIGPLLVGRMLSMAFMTFLFMLVYSNIMASLSSHFLSKDLPMLMAAPIRPATLFLAKSVEALLGSSWMVILMCLPLYAAFGAVKDVGVGFYVMALGATIPFLLIPAAGSMAANLGLIRVFPVQRMREMMLVIGTMMFSGAVIVFRMLEPEKLIDPTKEMQVFEYMQTLSAPSAPWLPSAWIGKAVVAAANPTADPLAYWINAGLLWGTAALCWVLAWLLASKVYRRAWQMARESMGVTRGARLATVWLPRRAGAYAAVLLKDVKIFLREPSQWGQIMLLSSLVLIYLFNISRIPKDVAVGLKELLFFLNMGFIGLIVTAVAARFVFPQVSLEGPSFALLRLAPISIERYLWTRWSAGLAPLLVLALALVGFSIPLLGAGGFMAVTAFVTIIGMTLAIGGLAVGFGARFAKFRISNPEEIVTSAGGFTFMSSAMVCIIVVLVLESQPVRLYYWAKMFRHTPPGWWLPGVMVAAVCLLTALCVIWPVRYGARSLAAREL